MMSVALIIALGTILIVGPHISAWNTKDHRDKIQITHPLPRSIITSPLLIEGMARGTWFFEASFPVTITDWNGNIIGQGYTTTDGAEWMTEDFVPFSGIIMFDTQEIQGQYSQRGTLILHKANASGLPEHADALEIPILFE